MKIWIMYRAAQYHKSLDTIIAPIVDNGDIVVVYCAGDERLASYTSVYASREILPQIQARTGWVWMTNPVFGRIHVNTEYGEGVNLLQRIYPDAVIFMPTYDDDTELEEGMESFVEQR